MKNVIANEFFEVASSLVEMMWERREIENYFCTVAVLIAYAQHDLNDDLFDRAEAEKRIAAMESSIQEVENALETLGKPESKPWSNDIKASDDFLEPVFRKYFAKLGLPILLRKTEYCQLAKFLKKEDIDPEIVKKLNAIVEVAARARPRT